MTYPAQTSLIPVQIALVRFWESQGWQAFFANYPYWYLGTTPFRYLTGPILPSILAVIHRLVPNLSLFEIMFWVMVVSWMVGAVGVYFLVKALKNTEKHGIAVLAAFFYLFGPIVPFFFRFSDGLYLMAFSFLPFVYARYVNFLRGERRGIDILFYLLIVFVILLDSLAIPTLLLGMAAIFLAQVGWKKAEEKLKRSLVFGVWCLVLVTLWYTPGYWWTLLGAPSFGGKGLAEVIVWLGKLLPVALAFTLAVFSVKFFKKRNVFRDFCFYWLFIFGFLTFVRFLSDPDFWLDWLAYGTELQLGLAITLGLFFEDRKHKSEDGFRRQMTEDKQIISFPFSVFGNLFSVFSFRSSFFFVLHLLLFTIIFNKYVLGTLQKNITQTVEYRIGKYLSETAKPGERVFLSGTTAFWLNAFFDIPQVRGGVDQAAVDPSWRKAVWEIREGIDPKKSAEWLKALKISYLVVHTDKSEEFYHDFVNPEKFEGIPSLKKIYDKGGDRIYKVLD